MVHRAEKGASVEHLKLLKHAGNHANTRETTQTRGETTQTRGETTPCCFYPTVGCVFCAPVTVNVNNTEEKVCS